MRSQVPLGTLTASLDAAPTALGQSAPLPAGFVAFAPTTQTAMVESEKVVSVAVAAAPELSQSVPMPTPRPIALGPPANLTRPSSAAARQMAQSPAVAPAEPASAGSIFDKLFGGKTEQPTGPVLAYANPQDGAVSGSLGSSSTLTGRPALPYDKQTAVYDISARTVYLPNGTKLEAHSGLREMLDDPRHVHVKMRGATPPAVYDLKLRESLFHGVRALRLTPTDSTVFGRAGLLAHTYMLGPNGDSNGCVSFKNYDAFLQAYLRGDIKRLAVVARL